MFWRYKNILITARHVANALSSSTASVYLASVKENAKKNFVVGDVVSASDISFDMDANLVKDLTLDVFAVELQPKQWARLGVTSASTKLRSLYKQHVSAVGFVEKGLLVTSTGATLEKSGPVELWHTASTRKGFSGSPLFCGSSVVGMHVGGSSARNVAIRIEVIADALKYQDESNTPDEEGFRQDRKFNGRSATLERLHDDRYAVMTGDGAVSYGWEEEEVQDRFRSMWDLDEKEQDRYQDQYLSSKFKRGKVHSYGDENASLSAEEPIQLAEPEVVMKRCWKVLPREKPGKGPSNPKLEPLISEWLDTEASTLETLGYDKEKFQYPDMSTSAEVRSVEKHLELFHSRAESIEKPPTKKEAERCVGLVAKMMAANRFEPDAAYKTKSYVEMIINSSLCKPGKSSGYPHCANGLPNNEAVLRLYGVGGLAQMVLNEWNEKFDLKCFLKSEPTKKTKVENGMPRVIVGLPVHKLLKHAAIFKNFATALSENWELSPVKFGFVPGNPGHMESLARWLGKGEIVESDKKNWDYMFHDWCFEICKKVTMELASCPLGMKEEEFAEYLGDISEAFDEVYKESRYRTSNGTVYQPHHDGAMKSGWFMTIAANSTAQIALNTLILMRLGYNDEQILEEFKIVAGGDDVLQRLPEVDLDKYKAEAALLGTPIDEMVVRPNMADGYEFFSHEISYNRRDGHWKFKPVRFTKHIEHLRRVKLEDLPQALVSHMGNWRWCDRQFRFFERMYKVFREKRPDLFELRLLQTAKALRHKQLGYEGGDW